jgi:hypothetical protein
MLLFTWIKRKHFRLLNRISWWFSVSLRGYVSSIRAFLSTTRVSQKVPTIKAALEI